MLTAYTDGYTAGLHAASYAAGWVLAVALLLVLVAAVLLVLYAAALPTVRTIHGRVTTYQLRRTAARSGRTPGA